MLCSPPTSIVATASPRMSRIPRSLMHLGLRRGCPQYQGHTVSAFQAVPLQQVGPQCGIELDPVVSGVSISISLQTKVRPSHITVAACCRFPTRHCRACLLLALLPSHSCTSLHILPSFGCRTLTTQCLSVVFESEEQLGCV